MARGSPDWRYYSPYRIGAGVDSATVTVGASETKDIVEIVGGGYLYGIRIYVYSASSLSSDTAYCYLDGDALCVMSMSYLSRVCYAPPVDGVFYIAQYDQSAYDLDVYMKCNLPFTSGVLVRWGRGPVGNCTVIGYITTSKL